MARTPKNVKLPAIFISANIFVYPKVCLLNTNQDVCRKPPLQSAARFLAAGAGPGGGWEMAPFRACIDELHACSFFLTHRSNSGLDFSTDVSKAPLRRASSFVWAVRHFPGLAAGIDDRVFLTATPESHGCRRRKSSADGRPADEHPASPAHLRCKKRPKTYKKHVLVVSTCNFLYVLLTKPPAYPKILSPKPPAARQIKNNKIIIIF